MPTTSSPPLEAMRRERRTRLALLAALAPVPLLFAVAANRAFVLAAIVGAAALVVAFRRGSRFRLPDLVLNLLGGAAVSGIFVLRPLVAPTLTALAIHLLLFLLLVRLASLRGAREEWTALILEVFLVVAAAATAVDPSIAVYLAVMLGLFVDSLMRFVYLDDVAEVDGRVIGDLGRIPGRGFVAALAAAIALVSIPVFVLLPRARSPFIRGLATDVAIATSFGDSIDMNSVANLKLGNRVIFRAEFEPREAGVGDRETRFRGLVYRRYAAGRWERGESGYSIISFGTHAQLGPGDGGPTAEVSIRLVRTESASLFVPYDGLEIEFDRFVSYLETSPSGALTLRSPPDRPMGYVVRRSRRPLPASAGPRDADRELPAAGLERLRSLAEQLRGASDAESIRRVAEHLAAGFTYSLEPVRDAPELDPIERFLFETRRGQCEHFAAAMILLLRGAGVPARMVVGFMGGETQPFTDELVVREKHAHAWVEAWNDAEQSWEILDPTPAVGQPQVSQGTLTGQVSQIWEQMLFYWDRYVVGYDFRDQLGLGQLLREATAKAAAAIGNGPERAAEAARRFWEAIRDRWPEALALAGIAAVLAAGLRWALARHWPRFRGPRPGRAALERAYARLDRLGRLPERADRLTAREVLAQVGGRALAEPLALVTAAYERETFAGRELATEDRERLRAAMARFEEALGAEASG